MNRNVLLVVTGIVAAGFVAGCEWGDVSDEDAQLTETIGTGASDKSVYSGAFLHAHVKPGTVMIRAVGSIYVFTDAGGGGILTGPAGTTGRIVYETGAWSIDLQGATLPNLMAITANYSYYP